MHSFSQSSFRYLGLLSSILCLLLLAGSCNKADKELPPDKFPVQLTFDQLAPVSEMRFFVGGVERSPKNNQQDWQDFLERKYTTTTPTGITFHQSNFVEPDANSYSKASFTYYANDQIKFVTNIIETQRQDGITIMKSAVTNPVDLAPIVKSDLFKYTYAINPNGTYNYQYIATEGDQSLEVSLLYYKLVRYSEKGERTELAFGKMHNQFNELFIQTLQARDTLAVKEYRLTYTAKE